jgi:PIN domain nuclease of toxin-antitoxin system
VGLLLDTHALLWFLAGDPRLSSTAAKHIADRHTPVYASVVSAWEIVIKSATGKLTLGRPISELWLQSVPAAGLAVMNVTSEHVLAVESLPIHHRDPFDRLLAAQAVTEDLDLVSSDRAFGSYPVRLVW